MNVHGKPHSAFINRLRSIVTNSGEGLGASSASRPPIVRPSPDTNSNTVFSSSDAGDTSFQGGTVAPASAQPIFSALKATWQRNNISEWIEDVWAIALGAFAFYAALIYIYAVQA